MATKYENLRSEVERLEKDPQNYPSADVLLNQLKKSAAGGKRYRVLYNRARSAISSDKPASTKKKTTGGGRVAGAPRGLVRSGQLTGGFRTVGGGLPGSRR